MEDGDRDGDDDVVPLLSPSPSTDLWSSSFAARPRWLLLPLGDVAVSAGGWKEERSLNDVKLMPIKRPPLPQNGIIFSFLTHARKTVWLFNHCANTGFERNPRQPLLNNESRP